MANTAVTLSSAAGKRATTNNAERLLGYTHKFNVKFSDVACGTGNADTVTLTLGNTPAKWAVTRACAYVTTAFAGTTSFVMIVGTTTGTSCFIGSNAVQTASTLLKPTNGANCVASEASSTGSSSVVMQALFTNASGGSPSALSAGELNIYLNVIDLDQLA